MTRALARASPRCTSGSFASCLAVLSAMTLFSKYEMAMLLPTHETAMLSSTRQKQTAQATSHAAQGLTGSHAQQQQHYRCLQSDEEIDDLVGRASQIVIAMPAKAAGTSMNTFTKNCTGRKMPDNFLNSEGDLKGVLMMGSPVTIPKIIASHMYRDEPLVRLIAYIPKSVLLIYVHREENERLMSGIQQVFSRYGNRTVGEEELVQTITEKPLEIGFGGAEILTGKTYGAIEENAPNMIFVHYKQADKLQRVLAKHHCPKMLNEDAQRSNIASTKNSVTKVRFGANEEVDLQEWLAAKADLLQYALGMRKGGSRQGLTRMMEEELFGCKTEFVHV